MLYLIILVLALCLLSSTAKERQAASLKLKRYNPVFAALAIVTWGRIGLGMLAVSLQP